MYLNPFIVIILSSLSIFRYNMSHNRDHQITVIKPLLTSGNQGFQIFNTPATVTRRLGQRLFC